MKFYKIAGICKKYPYITIYETSQAQWISVGAAAYAVYGIPRIESGGELLSVMDVPEEKRERFEVKFIQDFHGAILDDADDGEIPLSDIGVSVMSRGSVMMPLSTTDGRIYWINERYLAPVEDEADITFWLRESADGMYTVAVKAGFQIKALIGVRIASPEMEETVQEVLYGCARSREKGYRVPSAVIEQCKGYQLPAVILSVRAFDRSILPPDEQIGMEDACDA